MEDDTSVRVAVRIRPQIPREVIDMCRICTSVASNEPQVWIGNDKAFTFDHVFDISTMQQQVYESCVQQLIEGCFEGYNATVLAYGQTGSGKTYTMGTGFDVSVVDVEELGIIPRAVDHLFEGIDERRQRAYDNNEPLPDFKIHCQFLELYNEELIDLFDATSETFKGKKSGIKIHEDSNGNIYTVGVTTRVVTSKQETLQCLKVGALSRRTASTQMNVQSSRSHAIFTLHIKQQRIAKPEDCDMDVDNNVNLNELETLTAKFHFVDLAGSERLKRTGATGERAKEGISINCGLLALGNVISALGDVAKRGSHVPYRDSKLTRLLQDSLGGNSRTFMIACISPSDRDFMETLNTLNYANRARNIKNKVVINQDKTSKTISLLKMEIQQLQLELMEYKQGKRVVLNGEESMNDMYHENTMLQTENSNLRVRIKALQETVDAVTVKNTQLLADKAVGGWISNGGENSDINNLIQGYIKELEELRNKYFESEHSCEVMRRNLSRTQTRLSLSPLHNQAVAFSGGYDIGCEAETESVNEVLEEARKDIEKMKETEQRARRRCLPYHSESDEEAEGKDKEESGEIEDDDKDEEETSDSDTDVIDEQHRLDIAQLSSEISIKQKLIDELEKSQKRLQTMKHSYEEKLVQLQNKIRATQEERDKVLENLGNIENYSDEKVKKVKSEYEKKLGDLSSELKKIQSAKKEHARMLKNQTQYERQMKTLRAELAEMKKAKVRLMTKSKEESNRHRESEKRNNKEIAQLKKETRVKDNQIRALQAEGKVRDVVLMRKQEEVAALRRVAKPMSDRVAGRVRGRPATLSAQQVSRKPPFSPKVAKSKWQHLEKNITKVVLNKKTVGSWEKEMERWLQDRENLGHQLDKCLRRLDVAIFESKGELAIRDIEEEIETLRANIDYIQENISECQTNIMQAEGGKEAQDGLDVASLVSGMTVEETKYMVEKLLNMTVSQSLIAAQRETSLKEMEAQMTQVMQSDALHKELLEHMLRQQDMDLYQCLYMNGKGESAPSSRSTSPVDSTSVTEFTLGSSSSTESLKRRKARRKTAANAEELLFGLSSQEATSSTGPIVDIQEENVEPVEPVVAAERRQDFKPRLTFDATKPTYNQPGKLSPNMQFKAGYYASSSSSSSTMQHSNNDNTSEPTPPVSPNSSRKVPGGRKENVFSRLTSSSSGSESSRQDRGIVEAYDGRPPSSRSSSLVCLHVAKGHTQAVVSVVATEDLLFTASNDRTVKVWDLHRGEEIASLGGHPNNVTVVRYCERTKEVFTGSSCYIKVWDLRSGDAKCSKTFLSSGLTSNGPLITNTPSRILKIPQGENQINDCIVDGYGTNLFSAAGNIVRAWDLRKYASYGKLCGGHQAAVTCLAVDDVAAGAVSDASNLVVTGSKDHFIKLFETNSFCGGILAAKKTLEPPHYDGVESLALVENMLFSGSRDMSIKKWDLATSQLKHSLNQAHKDWVCGLCVSPGGQSILSCCRGGYVRQWSVESCSLLGEVKAHSKQIHAVTTNGSCIFTASDDTTVRIWKFRNTTDSSREGSEDR